MKRPIPVALFSIALLATSTTFAIGPAPVHTQDRTACTSNCEHSAPAKPVQHPAGRRTVRFLA